MYCHDEHVDKEEKREKGQERRADWRRRNKELRDSSTSVMLEEGKVEKKKGTELFSDNFRRTRWILKGINSVMSCTSIITIL